MTNILSLIIGRANSKGLPNKNIKILNGKMVFQYSLEYSKNLELICPFNLDTVISSDSGIIQNFCMKEGVPFILRDESLSSDYAKVEDVIYDALLKIETKYDYVSLLYADMPTRYPEEFIKALEFLEDNKDYDCVFSMKSSKSHPHNLFILNENLLERKSYYYRRQDLNQYMMHDGHTILFRTKRFIDFMESGKPINYLYEAFGTKIKPMLNTKLTTTIDTSLDFELAKKILL